MRGQRLVIHADHNNLAHPGTIHENTVRILRQRMYVEEFAPTIKHVKGDNNDVTDTLSRVPQNKEVMTSDEIFTVTEEDNANK